MKVLILSLMFIFLLSCGLAEAQTDATYLGEFCIVDTSLLGRPPLPLFQVGALKYGDNHIALNGNWLGNIPEPIYGTAMVSGDKIVATLTTALVSETYGTSYAVIYLSVDSTSMYGTMTTMSMTFLPTPSQEPVIQGPIYIVSCNP